MGNEPPPPLTQQTPPDFTLVHEKVPTDEDSLRAVLSSNLNHFLTAIKEEDFVRIREMLHPEGFFYYTMGKLDPNQFSRKSLLESSGLLDGAYGYGENKDTLVNGLYWWDSIKNNYSNQTYHWYDCYGSLAYGFTGNWSSDHIIDPLDCEMAKAAINIRVAYIEHINPEIGEWDMLMVEFFQDRQKQWKIYAIGNLEWTP